MGHRPQRVEPVGSFIAERERGCRDPVPGFRGWRREDDARPCCCEGGGHRSDREASQRTSSLNFGEAFRFCPRAFCRSRKPDRAFHTVGGEHRSSLESPTERPSLRALCISTCLRCSDPFVVDLRCTAMSHNPHAVCFTSLSTSLPPLYAPSSSLTLPQPWSLSVRLSLTLPLLGDRSKAASTLADVIAGIQGQRNGYKGEAFRRAVTEACGWGEGGTESRRDGPLLQVVRTRVEVRKKDRDRAGVVICIDSSSVIREIQDLTRRPWVLE